MPNEQLLALAPTVGRVDRSTTTTVATRAEAIELEGDSLTLVRAVLDVLRAQKTRAEVLHALTAFGEDLAAEALDFLVERGVVVPARPASATWTAALRGVKVIGQGAVARAVVRAAGQAALVATASARPSAVRSGDVVVSVASSLFDARVLEADQACRAVGALHLPIIVDSAVAHIGPLVAPSVAGGPCARCALLRLMGVRHLNLFEVWRGAIDDESALVAEDQDEGLAALVAPHVIAFLKSVNDDGSVGDAGLGVGPLRGRQHALLRVDGSGLADLHRVRRHGHCPACVAPPPTLASLPADALATGAARTIAAWRTHLAETSESLPPAQPLVDDFADRTTGLITLAEEWSQRGDYFRRFPILWGGVNLVRDREWVTTELQGINGTGPTLDHRRLVCVSEGAERYAQYTHRPAVTHASFADVEEHALDPRELVLYTDDRYASAGFPREPFDARRPLWWSWGYGLTSGRARLLPTELVTVCLTDESYAERLVDQRLTSGAASHTSWHRALHNGLRELIERDAHMVAWYKHIPLPRVHVGERTGDAYADDLLGFLRSIGMELHILDLRVDFPVPTYLMVGRLKESRGSWQAGGAVFVAVADLDPLAALSRGLCETALHYETLCLTPHANKEWRNNPYDKDDPEQGWIGWWPTYMHYLNPANVAAASFLWSHDLTVDLAEFTSFAAGNPAGDVDAFLRLFNERKLEPWAFDLVGDEIVDLGFKVAKVVVPGLVDLTPGMQSRRLRAPRLEAVAERLGRPCLPAGETNRDPHPNA